MKNVLFAINMEGITPNEVKSFEEKTTLALRSGSKDYAEVKPYHADYKEAVLRSCSQFDIDVLIINERLQGCDDFAKLIKEVKSEFPTILIVALITDNKMIGDPMLANLVATGVYNWIPSPWKPEKVANLVISPKKLKEVENYMPRIVEGKNGLAFDKVVVDNKDEFSRPDELNDILKMSNNGELVDALDDVDEKVSQDDVIFTKKIKTRKGVFGRILKPKATVSEAPAAEVQKEEPVQETEKEETVKFSEDMDFAQFMNANKKEPEKPVTYNIPDEPDILTLDDPEPVKSEPVVEVKEPVEIPTKKKKPNGIKNFQETMIAFPKIDETTLSQINFVPKYKRILFVRALPLSSLVPSHICKLMNATFVDFNKNSSAGNMIPNTVKTTIKEHDIPDDEYLVGDVVAGNGVETLLPYFEHVVVILPEDSYAIANFVERYSFISECGVVIDKATTGVLNFKQLLKLIPESKYIDTVKIEDCRKDVERAFMKNELLMENPLYQKSLSFLLKDLGV